MHKFDPITSFTGLNPKNQVMDVHKNMSTKTFTELLFSKVTVEEPRGRTGIKTQM